MIVADMTGPTLPRYDRFKADSYYSAQRNCIRWRWTYTTDSGETVMGTAQSHTKARQAAEKKSGERIR